MNRSRLADGTAKTRGKKGVMMRRALGCGGAMSRGRRTVRSFAVLSWLVATVALGAAVGAEAKPVPPLELQAVVIDTVGVLDDVIQVEVTLAAQRHLSDVEVTVRAADDTSGVGVLERTAVGEVYPGRPEVLDCALSIHEGRTEYIITASASRPNGDEWFTHSVHLYTILDGDGLWWSTSSFTELEIQRAQGAPDKLAEVLGGGAVEDSAPVPMLALTEAEEYVSWLAGVQPTVHAEVTAGTVTVSGQIRWTDDDETTHPVRFAPVEIRDDEGGGSVLVATVTTDVAGNYSAVVDNNDGPGEGGRDVFVRVLCQSNGATVRPPGLPGVVYFLESPVHSDVPDGVAPPINLTANDSDDNNTAFSVRDALVSVSLYADRVAGTMPGSIDCIFPTTAHTSLYDGSNLHILRLDRWDWDVVQHEYGHYVSDLYNLDNSPGGSHSSGENLAERLGKDAGIRLAWGEGWPTFFAISGQQVMGDGGLGIPRVGDSSYSDTEDITLSYSLETQTGGASLGEDNELAVSRVLYDLYDPTSSDDGGDRVALGDQTIWNNVESAHAHTLSAAWAALIAGRSAREQALYGAILSEHNVAPDPTSPANDETVAPDSPPTFEWDANGAGPSFRCNEFTVAFYDSAWNLIFESPQVTTTAGPGGYPATAEYTPTEEEWETILTGVDVSGMVVNWVVRGGNTNAPGTGTYTGRPRRFLCPKLDLIFTIDVTGSMWDDIAAVKVAATAIVGAVDLLLDDYRLALVSYRDFPVYPYGSPDDFVYHDNCGFTSDTGTIVAAIWSLSVGGGADWREAVYSALMHSLDSTSLGGWRDGVKKAVIPMGDAPPHDPEPFTGYTLWDVVDMAFAVDPASIYSVIVGGDATTIAYFTALAEETGGTAVSAANASEVVDAIIESITAVVEAPVAEAGGPYASTIGVAIEFDASGSFDPDGIIVSYEWDWENDGVYDEASSSPTTTHVWASEFTGTVRLRVTDDDGRTGVDTAEVIVAGPSIIAADVDIDPNTLNLKSKGRWITCYIELPEPYDASSIVLSSVWALGSVCAEPTPSEVGDYDLDGVPDLMIKFPRAAVASLVSTGEVVPIVVTGELADDTEFEGTDTIRVIEPGRLK